LDCQAVWCITWKSASLAETESGIRGMEMEIVLQLFKTKEISWQIFEVAVPFFLTLSGVLLLCYCVKNWWKMIKKE
jgi:hypothetical protein